MRINKINFNTFKAQIPKQKKQTPLQNAQNPITKFDAPYYNTINFKGSRDVSIPKDKLDDVFKKSYEIFQDEFDAHFFSNELYKMCYMDGEFIEENFDFLKTVIDKKGKYIFNGRCFYSYRDEDVMHSRQKLLEFLDSNKNIIVFNECYDLCEDDEGFNDELFQTARTLFEDENNYYEDNIRLLKALQKVTGKYSPDPNQRLECLKALKNVDKELQEKLNLGAKISELEASFNNKPVNPINEKTRMEFIKGVLASDETKTPFETTICQSIEKLKEFNQGLPLLFSKEDFLNELNELDLDEEIFNKLQIKPNSPSSYEGLINLQNLDITNEKEEKVYDLCHKFLYENAVQTGDKELDSELNKIIKAIPEFINIIGKTQHGGHKYTLDIHSLLVLAYSISDPDYSKLSPNDKAALKLSAIVHDINKKEDSLDKEHPLASSLNAQTISSKFYKSLNEQDRIYNLVKNHHWLERLETAPSKESEAKKIAFEFRHQNDFEIAKIIARADLKSVSYSFYKKFKKSLNDKKLVEENINKIYSNASAVFTYFPTSNQGYRIIDLKRASKDEDMFDYGFGFKRGLKRKDLMLLVHMIKEKDAYSQLNNLKELSLQKAQSILSESVITPSRQATFQDRKFGVILSQSNADVLDIDNKNQYSGFEKSFQKSEKLMYRKERENFKKAVLSSLQVECSDEEYAEFYKKIILPKTSLDQFKPDKFFELGGKKFSEASLRKAIYNFQKSLLADCYNNEIVGCTPKIKGIVAKVGSKEKIPDEILNFAKENNLPVVLI